MSIGTPLTTDSLPADRQRRQGIRLFRNIMAA